MIRLQMLASNPCDLLKMWVSDPRVPITYDVDAGKYILTVSQGVRIPMGFCPFCGQNLAAERGKARSVKRTCGHLEELSHERGSSVVLHTVQQEYFIFGSDGIRVRLLYCPVCGDKLCLQDNSALFHKISPTERAALMRKCEGISTMEEALRILGSPDHEAGPVALDLYPKGQKATMVFKRSFLYGQLAETVKVVVIELADGSVVVKYHAKERAPTTGVGERER